MSRLTGLLVGYAQSALQSYAYTYDGAGNRLSMTDGLGTRNYTYDRIYQMTQATNPLIPTEQYAYDPAGNRLGTTVDAGNRLLGDASFTYAYDNNGNLVQRTGGGMTTTYAYDPEMRLIQVSQPGMTASYKYDPFGKRLEPNVNGTVTRYFYDRQDIIADLDSNNQVLETYTHGPGIDEPLSTQANGQKATIIGTASAR